MRTLRHPWLMSFMSEIPAPGGESQVEDTSADAPVPGDQGQEEEKTPAGESSNEEGEGQSSAPESDEDEPLGEGGKKALEAERVLRKAAEAELRDMKAQMEAAKADTDRHVALVTARFKAAAAAGIPAELVDRLQGSTPEELEADAKALAAHLRPAYSPPIDPSQGKDREGEKGGGVAAGRDLYHEVHKGKKEKK